MGKKKGISAISLTMLALGTVIGGSFFLGSSVAINAAGPSIIIAYVFGAVLVYYILFAMSEMTVANPDCGSFRTFAAQAFGPRTAFVVGWIYWSGMVLSMSSEATALRHSAQAVDTANSHVRFGQCDHCHCNARQTCLALRSSPGSKARWPASKSSRLSPSSCSLSCC